MSQIILKTSLVIEGSPKSSFWGKNFEGKSQKGFFCQKTIHVYSLPKFVSLKTGACPTISVYLFRGLGGVPAPNDFVARRRKLFLQYWGKTQNLVQKYFYPRFPL